MDKFNFGLNDEGNQTEKDLRTRILMKGIHSVIEDFPEIMKNPHLTIEEPNKRGEMKIVAWLITLSMFSLSFLGCAKNYSYETADQVMGKTTITRNRLAGVTTVEGPYAETNDKKAMYLLTAKYTKGQMVSCQLVIYQTRMRQRGPAFYYQAFDNDGNKMEFSRFVDTFSDSDEKVGITLTKEQLERSRETGMEFKLFGKRDELSLKVESFYIEGFLAKSKEAV